LSPFEYLLALVSILIGLAVADLSSSLHRLLRARRRVRWDWLPLAGAFLVILLILEFWWNLWPRGTR
jgi:H+/Cl- antiporter ClcA